MKLSLVFELLLIFVLLAFAASKTVTGKQRNNKKEIQNQNDDTKIEDNTINKYCKCSEAFCKCCRDFAVPVVNLNGPGCASLWYINGDKMSVSVSFGRKVIANRTLSSRKPSPVCMPLPGGISKFCGRVYNIARTGEEFRACLGLELQSKKTVEAAVRVSCFKFGPRGVTSEAADPLPLVPQDEKVEEDDDDDDDDDDDEDDFGLGGEDADDDDDDEDDDDDDDDDDAGLDAVNDVDSADYTGFSLLGDDLLGDLFGSTGDKKSNKNKKKQAPTTTTTTTRRPRPSRRPTRRPNRTTTPRTRTTTVRVVRPISRRPSTRRPIRRPVNPNRRPTTASITESTTISTTISSTAASTESIENNAPDNYPFGSAVRLPLIEPVPISDEQPAAVETTPKSVTTFEDPGLELSLAHITDQLSVMPVTPKAPTVNKDAEVKNTNEESVSYEKIETITPKISTIVPISEASETVVSDDMVQIVQTLDSQSEEHAADQETMGTDESRGHGFDTHIVSNNYFEGLTLPKRKHRGENFNLHDLDVLDLTKIGESVGHELGIFGRNRRQNKHHKHHKPQINGNNNDKEDEYDDVLGLETLSDSIGMRRRQNKMMRGIWSNV
ncbi:uncharacterized protein [Epargyreus clarus]|uniref:uncharacterized protein n=1 Tax=Epargyreus clarus TaxID=520877 RepID=UPI003C2F8C5B